MQVSDQRSDAIGRLLLRLADLVELPRNVLDPALLEELPGNVDLDREAEQDLCEVVMEIARDLESFVGAFLRHRVRECAKDLLSVLELLVCFLESLRSEEHLSCEKQRGEDRRQGPIVNLVEQERDAQSDQAEAQVAQ